MIQCVCDRCKKVIEGTTTYHITIFAEDINPTPEDSLTSATTAITNINNAFKNALNRKKDYCKNCKNEIENFIEGGGTDG